MPDNRELATLIFFGAIALTMFAWRPTRAPVFTILRMIFWSRMTLVWVGALVWLTFGIVPLWWGDIWDQSHLKDTVIWCLFGGVLLVFQGIQAGNPNGEFKTVVRDQFKFLLFFELVMNAYPLSLAWELGLLMAFSFLALLIAFAELDASHVTARKLFTFMIAFLLFALVAVSIWHFYQKPKEVFSRSGLDDFCLPIYLTFIVLPYGYLISVYAGYETLFVTRLASHAMMPPEIRRYAKWQLFKTCGLNANHTRRAQKFLSPEIRWADTREKIAEEIVRLREELAWKKPPVEEGVS